MDKGRAYNTIDEYIEGFPKPVQEKLKTLRKLIRKTAPDATEKISYRMPTFYLNGNLVCVFQRNRSPSPKESDRLFRAKLITDSRAIRSPDGVTRVRGRSERSDEIVFVPDYFFAVKISWGLVSDRLCAGDKAADSVF